MDIGFRKSTGLKRNGEINPKWLALLGLSNGLFWSLSSFHRLKYCRRLSNRRQPRQSRDLRDAMPGAQERVKERWSLD